MDRHGREANGAGAVGSGRPPARADVRRQRRRVRRVGWRRKPSRRCALVRRSCGARSGHAPLVASRRGRLHARSPPSWPGRPRLDPGIFRRQLLDVRHRAGLRAVRSIERRGRRVGPSRLRGSRHPDSGVLDGDHDLPGRAISWHFLERTSRAPRCARVRHRGGYRRNGTRDSRTRR